MTYLAPNGSSLSLVFSLYEGALVVEERISFHREEVMVQPMEVEMENI